MAFKFFGGQSINLDRKYLFAIVVVGLIFLLLLSYSGSKRFSIFDGLVSNPSAYSSEIVNSPAFAHKPILSDAPLPDAPLIDVPPPTNSVLQPVADPKDLLPKGSNEWMGSSQTNTPDLLEPKQFIGLDTVGQSLKNANLQIRSEPVIPKSNTWGIMMSSYEPDRMQVPFEIGSSDY